MGDQPSDEATAQVKAWLRKLKGWGRTPLARAHLDHLAENPGSSIGGMTTAEIEGLSARVFSEQQAENARKHRKPRRRGLRVRAIALAVRGEDIQSTAQLIDRIEADDGLTFDEEDIELAVVDGHIVVRDLASGGADVIPEDQLKTYLRRARNS